MSQKRHTKAANWKRGIDCTWNIFKNILIYMSAKVRVPFLQTFLAGSQILTDRKSNINYKQKSLLLISFFFRNYKATDHLISQGLLLKNRGSSKKHFPLKAGSKLPWVKQPCTVQVNEYKCCILMTPVESSLYKKHTGCVVGKREPFADV